VIGLRMILTFAHLGGKWVFYGGRVATDMYRCVITAPLLDLLPRHAQPPRRQDTLLSSSLLIIALSDLLALASQPSARLSLFLDVEASPPEGSNPPQTRVDSSPPNIGL